VALTQSQMVAAVADRADMSRADAKRALDALDEIVLEELGNAQKVSSRRARSADGARQARHQEAHRAQSGDRRGDHDRGQAGERRCPSASVGKGQGGASVGAEGAAAAGGVKRTRLAIAPARLDQRPNAKPDKGRLRGRRQRMRSFGVTAPRLLAHLPFPVRDGRPRRRTSSFCAVWLSSTSGSHAVATPNGRRTIEGSSLAMASTETVQPPPNCRENSTVAGISSGCRRGCCANHSNTHCCSDGGRTASRIRPIRYVLPIGGADRCHQHVLSRRPIDAPGF
jgi:hypothetical protein